MRVRSRLMLRLRRPMVTRCLRLRLEKAEETIRHLEWRLRSESQRLAEARLQLAQERGWRYDMPAGRAAARMEALRDSGATEPEPR
jgi:hypothetical protein